jgi:hypothetical protein
MTTSTHSHPSSPSLADRLNTTALRGVTSRQVHEEIRRRAEERERQQVERNFEKLRREQTGRGGLLNFVRYFWHALEPRTRKLVEGWPLEAICNHLEALTFGDIPSNRLLMNVPPGFMKSLLVNVFWPAWEWGPCNMPHMRYISFSYSDEITTRDNNKMSRLVTSPAYKQLWGDRFTMTKTGPETGEPWGGNEIGWTDPRACYISFSYSDEITTRDNNKMSRLVTSPAYKQLWGDRFQMTKTGERRLENNQTGFKLATSVGGVSTGERGDRILLDDPHKVIKAESDVEREKTVQFVRESMSNRPNDEQSTIVVITQRLHEGDVSGDILTRDPIGRSPSCAIASAVLHPPKKSDGGLRGAELGFQRFLVSDRFELTHLLCAGLPRHVPVRKQGLS